MFFVIEVSKSSIYDHLDDLLEGGLVEYEMEGRRKVYRLTDDGESLLEALE